jgi:uncharacterized membrane protein YcaP (DUF421 family)
MEIVFRALVVFFFLWVVTRAVGRSSLGELSTFQLLLYVTMGDLVQQSVTQQDYSVTAAVLAVSTFAVLTALFSWIHWRWPRTRSVVSGVPLVVIKDGEPLYDAMKQERLSLDDLYAELRQQGIERMANVEIAVLETDGKISFFTRPGSKGDSGAPDVQPSAA